MAEITTEEVTLYTHTLTLSDTELKILTAAVGNVTKSRIIEKYPDTRHLNDLEVTMMNLWDTLRDV